MEVLLESEGSIVEDEKKEVKDVTLVRLLVKAVVLLETR